MAIRFKRFKYRFIKHIGRQARKGHVQINLTLEGDPNRFINIKARNATEAVLKSVITTNSMSHPYIVRINWTTPKKFLFPRNRKRTLNVLKVITRMAIIRSNFSLSIAANTWRGSWYSVGYSKHYNCIYSLIALRHADPLLEVLMERSPMEARRS
jgi:hypothetical protein